MNSTKNMKQMHTISRNQKRHRFIRSGVLVGLGIVVLRLAWIQYGYGPKLNTMADSVNSADKTILAPRGSILGSNGQPLAYDVPVYTMDIHISALGNKAEVLARELAPQLGMNLIQVSSLLTGHYTWLQWPNPVSSSVKSHIVHEMSKLYSGPDKSTPNIGNLIAFYPSEQRFYPDGVFASNIIGYVNSAAVGQAGLEAEYNSVLQGENGLEKVVYEGDGTPIASDSRLLKKPAPGDNVQLTINPVIQGFVENAMNGLMEKDKPANAAIIVMDPNTGAILAMTSRPTFNPNQYQNSTAKVLSSNWAVNEPFEPGSTFKPIVLSAALTEHKISLNNTFMSGNTTIDGVTIHDWNWIGWGRLSFLGALEKSSNVGFAKIAERLGWPDLIKFMNRFGFLQPTGIDLPNESNSLIFPQNERGPVQLATAGFGQGIAVTPLQQMAAIGVIANGGTLYKPYIASATINPATHHVIKKVEPTVERANVIPRSVASAVRQAMIDDVNSPAGIDQSAYLPGYDVAGKTGTAQIANPKTGQYYNNRYNVSFIGYAPGWDPKIEVMVTVNWPKTPIGSTWGSTISAPVAKTVLLDCLQYYHIQPKTRPAQSGNSAKINANTYSTVPDLVGEGVQVAKRSVLSDHLAPEVLGSNRGTVVMNQWPPAGTKITKGSSVYLSTPTRASDKNVQVPNLMGASLREVGGMLASIGLKMEPHGTGYAIHQGVAAGTLVPRGTKIPVTFSSPSP